MLQKLAPEIGAINLTPDSGASFSCWCATSNVINLPRRQSMTLEVVHPYEKLAPESGVEFRPMAPISGVCVRGLRSHVRTAHASAYNCPWLLYTIQHIPVPIISYISYSRQISQLRCYLLNGRELLSLSTCAQKVPSSGLCRHSLHHQWLALCHPSSCLLLHGSQSLLLDFYYSLPTEIHLHINVCTNIYVVTVTTDGVTTTLKWPLCQ